MGIVSKQEADDDADIASTTGGVQKVVKLFEYRG
jgi:osmotically-inducible protein OsmY